MVPEPIDPSVVARWMGRMDASQEQQTEMLKALVDSLKAQDKRIDSLETSRTRFKAGWVTLSTMLTMAAFVLSTKLAELADHIFHNTHR